MRRSNERYAHTGISLFDHMEYTKLWSVYCQRYCLHHLMTGMRRAILPLLPKLISETAGKPVIQNDISVTQVSLRP